MNPTGKKFISLLLVFSLMMLSVNLYAKKRGATIVITKKDGKRFQGELITVKQNSLLILVPSGKDESFDIEDIKIIEVVEKPKVTQRLLRGAIWGPVAYSICLLCLYPIFGGYEGERITLSRYYKNALPGILLSPLFFAATFAVFRPKFIRKFKIEEMTDSEIQETLNKLRKNARIRDYR